MNNEPKTPKKIETKKQDTTTNAKLIVTSLVVIGITTGACMGFYNQKIKKIQVEYQTQTKQTTEQLQNLKEQITQLLDGLDPKHEAINENTLDQGYQTAIWDVYFGTPRYLIQEDTKGVSLWKKQEIDPNTIQRINRENQEETKQNSSEVKD